VTPPVLPADVAAALESLVGELRRAAGDNLRGVALYGGLAKGRYTAGISDINLLVVLERTGFNELAALAPVLTAARRSDRVAPLVLSPADLAAIGRVFPVMLLDMQAAHRPVWGDTGLAAVIADRGALRFRLRQEILNLDLRFRRVIFERGGEPAVLLRHLGGSLPQLAVTLESVLRLAGEPVPATRGEVLLRAATLLGIPAAEVEPFARFHRHQAPPPDQAGERLGRDFVSLLSRLVSAIEASYA